MEYEKIRELREDKGWTQQYLADLLFVNRRTYSSYETGNRTISPDILIELSKVHNVSIDYLLGLTNEKKPYPRKK
ncbi:MAG: helix-turn-helix domain-containing protein [Defluviitaleaceae bacterium]|nr:helix-turn-helix domain-containing protein [Defluviitaleaceae bacterium]